MPTNLNVSLDARPPPDGLTDHHHDGMVSSATALKLPGDRVVSIWVVPLTAAGDGWVAAAGWETIGKRFEWAGPPTKDARSRVRFDFATVVAGVEAAAVLVLQPHVNRTYLAPTVSQKPADPIAAEIEAINAAFRDQNQFGGLSMALLYRPLMPAIRTALAAESQPLTFHLVACLYPGGIFDRSAFPSPGLDAACANAPGPADRGLRRLRDVRKGKGKGNGPPRTPLILAGDQIYADATAGLLDPTLGGSSLDQLYDSLMQQTWRNHALAGSVDPTALMDDHEVVNDWEPSLHPARNAALHETLRIAREHFVDRQRHAASCRVPRLWQSKTLGGRLLFVGDTRSERSERDPACIAHATIISEAQRKALYDALSHAPKDQHKFIATPSILLPRRLSVAECPDQPAAALCVDSWCGYPGSLHGLLAHVCDGAIQGCVFLSGDEHIGCVATVVVVRLGDDNQPGGPELSLWAIHAGALYAPFPFANSVREDFPEHDCFEFRVDHRRYRCTVKAWFPDVRDSCVEIALADDGQGRERLNVAYFDGLDQRRDARWPGP